jgi:hypothetical protein
MLNDSQFVDEVTARSEGGQPTTSGDTLVETVAVQRDDES